MESAGDPAQLSIGNLPARQECFDFSPDPGFRVWGFGFVVLGSGFNGLQMASGFRDLGFSVASYSES